MESLGIDELSLMTYNLLLDSLVQNTTEEDWIEAFPSIITLDTIKNLRELFFNYITSTSNINDKSNEIFQILSKNIYFSDLYNYYVLTSSKQTELDTFPNIIEDDDDVASVDSWNSLNYYIKNSPKTHQISPQHQISSDILQKYYSVKNNLGNINNMPSPYTLNFSNASTPLNIPKQYSTNILSPLQNQSIINLNSKSSTPTSKSSTPSSRSSTPINKSSTLNNKSTSLRNKLSPHDKSLNNATMRPYESPSSPLSKAAQMYTEVKYCDNQLTLEVSLFIDD